MDHAVLPLLKVQSEFESSRLEIVAELKLLQDNLSKRASELLATSKNAVLLGQG